MLWRALEDFRDAAVPKLDNLRRAAAAGLRVPETRWAPAGALDAQGPAPRPGLGPGALIVRSGSPTEDTEESSNAGQLLSLTVAPEEDFAAAVARVVAALPRDPEGQILGAVFVQPLIEAEEAGVAFFDGFYFERAAARGGNEAITSGLERGAVRRGHVERGEAWTDWLLDIYATMSGRRGQHEAIDIEFAEDAAGPILLQARPALFPVTRNPTLSLANHKEILGDPPSPWIASVLGQAGALVLAFFARIDPGIARWDENYAVLLAERAWMNFSFFFRLMDRWGLPRSFVTDGVGGEVRSPRDRRPLWGRFLRSAPRLVLLQVLSLWESLRAGARLRVLDAKLKTAKSAAELFAVNVEAMRLAITINFAINGVLSGVARMRRALRIPGRAKVVTEAMMAEYRAITRRPPGERAAALEAWLSRYGHRGPLESDPARPRFVELAETLRADLESAPAGAAPLNESRRPGLLTAPLFWIDRRREWFRDELMRRWLPLRRALLAEGQRLVEQGALRRAEDIFQLRAEDLKAPQESWGERAEANRSRCQQSLALSLPLTASKDAIVAAMKSEDSTEEDGRERFDGIALSPEKIEGEALLARELTELLAEIRGRDCSACILVVPALEPSWAVVFPRFAGVVAEIGGELSHASILLREARKPAIVNCRGIIAALQSGDRLVLDGPEARVRILRGEAGPAERADAVS